jgi:phage tail sheath protein FI
MPTYIKPGVYIEENVSAVRPVDNSTASSVAVFVGVADRGPTKKDASNNVLAVPTLVTSWSDYTNKFAMSSTIDPFKVTVDTNSNNLKYAVKSFFDNGGAQAYVMHTVSSNAVAASVTLGTNITVTAANEGSWGNRLWAEVIVNNNSTYDLYVYYNDSITATAGEVSYSSNHIEHFSQLSNSSTSSRYAPSVVQSNFVKLTAVSSTNPTAAKQKLTGGTEGLALPDITSTAATNLLTQIDAVEGPLVVNFPRSQAYTSYVPVTNKEASTTVATLTVATGHGIVNGDVIHVDNVNGADSGFDGNKVAVVGTSATTITYARAGTAVTSASVTSGVIRVFGKVGVTGTTSSYSIVSNAVLNYAGTREDAFVVLDVPNVAVGTSADTTTVTALGAISATILPSAYKKLGAAYYPYITVGDPLSRTGGTVSIAPGGAVTAMYLNADQQKGAFQSPAGIGARVNDAVSVGSLTTSDFTAISNNTTALNVIRYVPGAGICVMGARTLSGTFNERYVAMRRSLQYINRALVNQTTYAVFEPNDSALWSRVRSTADSFLYRYWKQGGLKGDTPSEAYYVKCDSEINTTSSIDNGELRVEIGVALQRPAEFVIIRIGQMDGGATVTVSV